MTTNLAHTMDQHIYICYENDEHVVLEAPGHDGTGFGREYVEVARALIGSYDAKVLARELRNAADNMDPDHVREREARDDVLAALDTVFAYLTRNQDT